MSSFVSFTENVKFKENLDSDMFTCLTHSAKLLQLMNALSMAFDEFHDFISTLELLRIVFGIIVRDWERNDVKFVVCW